MKRKMNENAKASFCAGKKHSNRSARHIAGVVVGNLFVTLFSVSCLYPVIWLICASLNNKKDFTANPVALPSVPNFSNYGKVFSQTDMGLWMLNTLRNTAVSLPLILLFGFIAGYMLARCRFKGRTGLYCYFLLGIVIPIHALMIPMYVLFKKNGYHQPLVYAARPIYCIWDADCNFPDRKLRT
jgi:raffinose/stachyose/melibiose transport system permease protein